MRDQAEAAVLWPAAWRGAALGRLGIGWLRGYARWLGGGVGFLSMGVIQTSCEGILHGPADSFPAPGLAPMRQALPPVPRPHPIRRLIDGHPDDPGRRIARRTTLLMIPAIVGANLTGAVVVFALVTWVLPLPEVEDRGTLLLVNLVAAVAYVAVACVIGTVWGLAHWRATRNWLVSDREPDADERRTALRVPLRHLHVSMTLWAIAVVGMFAINVWFSLLLAVIVTVTTLLGAVTTGAMAYLLAERIMRAASARALAHGVPDSPVLPGVATRALLAWALGSGVPLVGLCAVAIVALAGAELGKQELALSALVLGGVALIVGAIITWQAARAVADPVNSVSQALARVEAGDLDARVPVFDGSDLGLLQAGFNRMSDGLREREELRDLFGRHVGEHVARKAAERGIELGGVESSRTAAAGSTSSRTTRRWPFSAPRCRSTTRRAARSPRAARWPDSSRPASTGSMPASGSRPGGRSRATSARSRASSTPRSATRSTWPRACASSPRRPTGGCSPPRARSSAPAGRRQVAGARTTRSRCAGAAPRRASPSRPSAFSGSASETLRAGAGVGSSRTVIATKPIAISGTPRDGRRARAGSGRRGRCP
jgi:HAMP domain-containing protein